MTTAKSFLRKLQPHLHTDTLANDILRNRRDYFIVDVKKPIREAIVGLGKCGSWLGMLISLIRMVRTIKMYPEATKENTRKPNTHVLMDIWDEFFKYENNPALPRYRDGKMKGVWHGREPLFRAMARIIIAEYEHDPYYSQRMDWFIKRLFEKYQSGEWKPPKPYYPAGCWTEPSAVEAYAKMKQELKESLPEGLTMRR